MRNDIIRLTDSYKTTHWLLYPKQTRRVWSYFESREGAVFDHTVFFGLQYYLKEYLVGQVVTQEKIDRAEPFINAHMGQKVFNRAGWEYILHKHGGRLPVEIKAVPEGTRVPISNVLMTVCNTDDNCPWLTNYLESLLTHVWYPSTVASQSYEMRNSILYYLNRTGSDKPDFKLHDFGFRGVTGPEQAGIGGLAHLLSFLGTDNLQGVCFGQDYYDCDMAGFSIPASEHSTITSWGRTKEFQAFRNMLEKFPGGHIACVSDSYNIWDACRNGWGSELRAAVLGRNGTLVVRPDSGTPHVVVPQILDILGDRFGYEKNKKGYKVLDPHVRVIQGDGIDRDSLPLILERMEELGWSADNIAFGSGGGLLQKLNRDTQRNAFKQSAILKDGNEWEDVYKEPVTDTSKLSKRGRLSLIKTTNSYETIRESNNRFNMDELKTVFLNGELIKDFRLDDVRQTLIGV